MPAFDLVRSGFRGGLAFAARPAAVLRLRADGGPLAPQPGLVEPRLSIRRTCGAGGAWAVIFAPHQCLWHRPWASQSGQNCLATASTSPPKPNGQSRLNKNGGPGNLELARQPHQGIDWHHYPHGSCYARVSAGETCISPMAAPARAGVPVAVRAAAGPGRQRRAGRRSGAGADAARTDRAGQRRLRHPWPGARAATGCAAGGAGAGHAGRARQLDAADCDGHFGFAGAGGHLRQPAGRTRRQRRHLHPLRQPYCRHGAGHHAGCGHAGGHWHAGRAAAPGAAAARSTRAGAAPARRTAGPRGRQAHSRRRCFHSRARRAPRPQRRLGRACSARGGQSDGGRGAARERDRRGGARHPGLAGADRRPQRAGGR